ncbi:Phosphatidylinositol-4-phosphate 5-kinase [Tilletia horrida]|nr:Phosphatidylinositol-4-phosphate 5-kinase [Tilletia horrida]
MLTASSTPAPAAPHSKSKSNGGGGGTSFIGTSNGVSSPPIQSSIKSALTANQQTIRVSDDTGNTYKLVFSQDKAYPNDLSSFAHPSPTTTAAPTADGHPQPFGVTSAAARLWHKAIPSSSTSQRPAVGAPPPSPPLESDLASFPRDTAEPSSTTAAAPANGGILSQPLNVNNAANASNPPVFTLTVPSPPTNSTPGPSVSQAAGSAPQRRGTPSSAKAPSASTPLPQGRRNSASSIGLQQHQQQPSSSASSAHSHNAWIAPNGSAPLVAEPQSITPAVDANVPSLRTGDAVFDEQYIKEEEKIRRAKRQKEKDAASRAADEAQRAQDKAAAGASATHPTHSHANSGGHAANALLTRAKTFRREPEEGRAERGDSKDEPTVLVGNLIGEDHVNYVLMYNMLTGIRIGVSRCEAKIKRPLTDADYRAKHKFTFDIIGNELTPSAKYDFKFKDYAPWVFRELREYFHLDPADYLLSLTAKYILSELGSPGKSGSFFYFSRDYRFIIKTIRHSEHKFLLSILKDYHEHVKANPHTLLSRFYGLHRVKLPHGRKIHFVIMNNLFPPHRDIHETYDLKGSAIGREYPEEKAKQKKGAVLKDLNWVHRNREIQLGPEKFALFKAQLQSDVALLARLNIMDYSLLIGLHDMRRGNTENLRQDALQVFQPETDVQSTTGTTAMPSSTSSPNPGGAAASTAASPVKLQRSGSKGGQRRQSQADAPQSSTIEMSERSVSRAGTIDGSMMGHGHQSRSSMSAGLGQLSNHSTTGVSAAGHGPANPGPPPGSSGSAAAPPFAGLKRSFTIASVLPSAAGVGGSAAANAAGTSASASAKARQAEKDAFALREAVRRSDPKALSAVTATLPDQDTSERRHFLFYQDEGGFRSSDANNQPGQTIYYLGVIDLFTPYTSIKRGETIFKGLTQNKAMISSVPPKQYAQRFINFLLSVCSSGDKSLRPKME